MNTFIDTIQSLSLSDKRALVKSLKQIIAEEVKTAKIDKIIQKEMKENLKKIKIEEQIKAAQDKLLKLQAKLTA
jgi:hypothetical protein